MWGRVPRPSSAVKQDCFMSRRRRTDSPSYGHGSGRTSAAKPVGKAHARIRGDTHTHHLTDRICGNQSVRTNAHFTGSVYRGCGEVLRGLPRPAAGNHRVHADIQPTLEKGPRQRQAKLLVGYAEAVAGSSSK